MKKTLSLFLSIIMLITTAGITAIADAEGTQITAYVTVSKYGEIVSDKDGDAIAMMPVELSGEESYDLTDVFTALHNECYDGGAESGYATAVGDYGLYISKFWGDESANFNYMINCEYAWGPTQLRQRV